MNRTNALILAALTGLIPGALAGSQFAYDSFAKGRIEMPAAFAEGVQLPSLIPSAHADVEWIASAPGRVEPQNGEIRIAAGYGARIVSVPVQINQKVTAGDVLVQLEDDGAAARLQSLKVETQNRKKDRDDDGGGDGEFRTREDAFATAEQEFWNKRDALDRAVERTRAGKASTEGSGGQAGLARDPAADQAPAQPKAVRNSIGRCPGAADPSCFSIGADQDPSTNGWHHPAVGSQGR
jgi:multidrug efflux pump subunit AcrA (membrane-fusion protein)